MQDKVTEYVEKAFALAGATAPQSVKDAYTTFLEKLKNSPEYSEARSARWRSGFMI